MVLVFASQVFWCLNSLFSHSWLFLNKNVSTWTTTMAFGISVDFGNVMYACVYTWVHNDWSVCKCVYVTRGEGNISFCFFFCLFVFLLLFTLFIEIEEQKIIISVALWVGQSFWPSSSRDLPVSYQPPLLGLQAWLHLS